MKIFIKKVAGLWALGWFIPHQIDS
jgi:hypothetical protein